MAKHDAVDRIERRAAAAQYQDGIMELFAAAMFIGVALFWQTDRGGLIPFLALVVVFGASAALAWAKKRITYPRIGYAEPRKPADTSPWSGVAFIGLGIALMVGAVAVFDEIDDPASWRRWAPFLVGFLSSAGFWYASEMSRLWRYRILAVFSGILGLAVSLGSDGSNYQPVAFYSAIMAAVLAALGVFTLVVFLVRHPKPQHNPTIES